MKVLVNELEIARYLPTYPSTQGTSLVLWMQVLPGPARGLFSTDTDRLPPILSMGSVWRLFGTDPP